MGKGRLYPTDILPHIIEKATGNGTEVTTDPGVQFLPAADAARGCSFSKTGRGCARLGTRAALTDEE